MDQKYRGRPQAAVDWNYLEENLARGIRLGDRTPAKERMYPLPEQLSPLLNSLRNHVEGL
jgi:hypothetical protein